MHQGGQALAQMQLSVHTYYVSLCLRAPNKWLDSNLLPWRVCCFGRSFVHQEAPKCRNDDKSSRAECVSLPDHHHQRSHDLSHIRVAQPFQLKNEIGFGANIHEWLWWRQRRQRYSHIDNGRPRWRAYRYRSCLLNQTRIHQRSSVCMCTDNNEVELK